MYVATHYEYAAASPMGRGSTIFRDLPAYVAPEPVIAGKIIRFDDALDTTEKIVEKAATKMHANIARYVAALSANKWTSTKDLAAALEVSTVSVTKIMHTDRMKALVRKSVRARGNTVYFVWRLK